MSEHAKYSPSQLEKLELCPSFEQDQTGDHSAAKEGTLLHKAIETGKLEGLTEEQEETAKRCIEYGDSVLNSLILSGETGVVQRFEVLNEVKIDITSEIFGTFDRLILSETAATLLDWKLGKLPVTKAEDNFQIQSYVVGVFKKYPKLKEIEAMLVCPRQDIISGFKYVRDDIEKIEKRIVDVIVRCEAKDKEENPCEEACRYCGRKASCKALTSTALTVSKNIGLPMPIEFEPGKLVRPVDRAKAQVLSYILEDWAKKVREYNTKAVVEDGIEIPGFEVRSRKGKLVVDNINAAADELLDKMGLTLATVMQACSVSVPKLVDQAYAQAKINEEGTTKSKIKEDLLAAIADYTTENNKVVYLQRKRGKTDEEIIQGCSD